MRTEIRELFCLFYKMKHEKKKSDIFTESVILCTYDPAQREMQDCKQGLECEMKSIEKLKVSVEISSTTSMNTYGFVRNAYCYLLDSSLEDTLPPLTSVCFPFPNVFYDTFSLSLFCSFSCLLTGSNMLIRKWGDVLAIKKKGGRGWKADVEKSKKQILIKGKSVFYCKVLQDHIGISSVIVHLKFFSFTGRYSHCKTIYF